MGDLSLSENLCTDGVAESSEARCPSCGYMFDKDENTWESAKYCPDCGQRLDWGEKTPEEG